MKFKLGELEFHSGINGDILLFPTPRGEREFAAALPAGAGLLTKDRLDTILRRCAGLAEDLGYIQHYMGSRSDEDRAQEVALVFARLVRVWLDDPAALVEVAP